jgi:hypothetical protein
LEGLRDVLRVERNRRGQKREGDGQNSARAGRECNRGARTSRRIYKTFSHTFIGAPPIQEPFRKRGFAKYLSEPFRPPGFAQNSETQNFRASGRQNRDQMPQLLLHIAIRAHGVGDLLAHSASKPFLSRQAQIAIRQKIGCATS